ncbi:Uncharacterised protein [Streptococcus pneumoniae]|nr:Uncharacterised protein [Streptococcus pneumoniae]
MLQRLGSREDGCPQKHGVLEQELPHHGQLGFPVVLLLHSRGRGHETERGDEHPYRPEAAQGRSARGEGLGGDESSHTDLGHPDQLRCLLLPQLLEHPGEQGAGGDQGPDVLHLVVLEFQGTDPDEVRHQGIAQYRIPHLLDPRGGSVLRHHFLVSSFFLVDITRT